MNRTKSPSIFLIWLAKIPTGILFLLVFPGYLLLALILLDGAEYVHVFPVSISLSELLPSVFVLSFFNLVVWQLPLLTRWPKRGLIGTLGLIVCSLCLLVLGILLMHTFEAMAYYFFDFQNDWLERIRDGFSLRTEGFFTGTLALLFICSPLFTAGALTSREGVTTFQRWFSTLLLILLFPLGVWWLQPRVRKVARKAEIGISDHFGI
jgi:hypothetical protein